MQRKRMEGEGPVEHCLDEVWPKCGVKILNWEE